MATRGIVTTSVVRFVPAFQEHLRSQLPNLKSLRFLPQEFIWYTLGSGFRTWFDSRLLVPCFLVLTKFWKKEKTTSVISVCNWIGFCTSVHMAQNWFIKSLALYNLTYRYQLHTSTKNKTSGVSHCGLAIYIKKYLQAKEELWKFKYFITQKYNLQKNPLIKTKVLQES
jgi:hypothetical protein